MELPFADAPVSPGAALFLGIEKVLGRPSDAQMLAWANRCNDFGDFVSDRR